MQDRNFDDIAEKFSRNIYGTTKGQLRQAILWQDLDRVLEEIGGRKLRVLDAGGGEGQTAIKMAEPRDPAQVYQWLEAIGWQITGKTGVRVFHDYLREKHQQRDCYETLVELETRYCRQEPYISLGRYIHVTAIKSPALAADARITYE